MGRKEKLIKKLKNNPKDFTFEEMKALLELLGFDMSNKRKNKRLPSEVYEKQHSHNSS